MSTQYQSCPKPLPCGSSSSEDGNRFLRSCFNLFLDEVSLDTINTLRTARWKKIKSAVSVIAQALERLKEGKMVLDLS